MTGAIDTGMSPLLPLQSMPTANAGAAADSFRPVVDALLAATPMPMPEFHQGLAQMPASSMPRNLQPFPGIEAHLAISEPVAPMPSAGDQADMIASSASASSDSAPGAATALAGALPGPQPAMPNADSAAASSDPALDNLAEAEPLSTTETATSSVSQAAPASQKAGEAAPMVMFALNGAATSAPAADGDKVSQPSRNEAAERPPSQRLTPAVPMAVSEPPPPPPPPIPMASPASSPVVLQSLMASASPIAMIQSSEAESVAVAPEIDEAPAALPGEAGAATSLLAALSIAPEPVRAMVAPEGDTRTSGQAAVSATSMGSTQRDAPAANDEGLPVDSFGSLVESGAGPGIPGDGPRPSATPGAMGGITAAALSRPDTSQPVAPSQPNFAAEPEIVARAGRLGQSMGVEIANRLAAGGEELVVRLVPADMGRIEVRMTFDDRTGLRAVITADNMAALDMLRRESGDLSRSLSDAGIRNDPQSLRFQSDGGGGNGQPRNPWFDRDGRSPRGASEGFADDATPTPYRAIRTSGRYDLLA
ncbi:flagellar hook-length control protein FliK [Sphingomonas sp. 37zxx]|uniref:flagellar hook-length control protein FliK n=1 Tax=Sphingomonas sp. 37zxx TaxID=1550073 RepID=UPI00053BE68B|nr:flagellar hook-length control protein FliK [Sphingomonas sp. 37zxx]